MEQMPIYLSKYENIGYAHALWNLTKNLKSLEFSIKKIVTCTYAETSRNI